MKDLARTLLSHEIRSLHHARRSGILAVSSGDVTKGIFFRVGRIAFASSTLDKDKLGENLIRLGRISRAEFVAAYKTTKERRKRLGQALIGAGLVTEEEMGRLVAHQVQKIVLSLFTWASGQMKFQEAEEPIPADLALDLSTHRLLLEGARIYPDAVRIEKALGPLDRRLRVAPRAPFDTGKVSLSPAEKAVLKDAAAELPISAILARPEPRSLLVRAVYALLAGGILEETDQEALEVIEVDTGTFRVAVAAAQAPRATDRREQILRLYEAMPRATHYQILEVPPDATLAVITEAHRRLTAQQDKDWRDLAGDVQLGSVLSTLRLRRRESFQVLSDANRREAYDRSLRGLKSSKPQEVTSEAHDEAERLAGKAVGLMDRDPEGAITLLLRGVELDPKDKACRRLLALTLAKHSTLSRTAERHFLTALELDPGDLDLRYRLAMYYKKAGIPARAVVQLKAVLAANPDADSARRELKAIERNQRRA